MIDLLEKIKSRILNVSDFEIENFILGTESQEYHACEFVVANKKIIHRSSKTTPKKTGTFVTFYQRNNTGIIEPFLDTYEFEFLLIYIRSLDGGFFVFPKSILIRKGILSTQIKEGKRAFRVYAPSDKVLSKQALNTQKWQINYFYHKKEQQKIIDLLTK